MRLVRFPTFGLTDDRLISPLVAKLFFVATILVLALTPVFLGTVDTARMSFWERLPWGVLGVLGPIGLFFLWIGMWRYWARIDTSRPWAKRIWFVVLLVGFWWGSCLYYSFVYLPQFVRRRRVEISGASSPNNSKGRNGERVGMFGRILIGSWAFFWGSTILVVLFPKLLPKVLSWIPYPLVTIRAVMISLTLVSAIYGIRWLYRQGIKHAKGK